MRPLQSVPLIVSLGLLGCGSSAETTLDVGGHDVEIEVVRRRELGIGAFGAPHAFGIIYPTIEDSGLVVTMTVDDRPGVQAAHRPDGNAEEVIELVEVAGSEDGHHLAVRLAPGPWIVFHLLPRGPPFDVPDSTVEADAVDFSALGEPRAIALSALRSEHALYGTPLWQAVTAQPDSEIDVAIAAHWPDDYVTRSYLSERLDATDDTALREAMGMRALGHIEAALDGGGDEGHVDLGARRAATRMLTESATAPHERRYRELMRDALIAADRELPPVLAEYVHELAGPDVTRLPDPEERTLQRLEGYPREATEALRLVTAYLDNPLGHSYQHDLRALGRIVGRAGTDEERGQLHDAVLEEWPSTALRGLDDGLVIAAARGGFGDTGPAWRERAIERASEAERSLDVAYTLATTLEAPPPRLEPIVLRMFEASVPQIARLAPDEQTSEAFKRRLVETCTRRGELERPQQQYCLATAVWLLGRAPEADREARCGDALTLCGEQPRPPVVEQLCGGAATTETTPSAPPEAPEGAP